MAFYTCPYCDGREETNLSAAYHVCDRIRVQTKINTLRAEVEGWKNRYDLAMVCYKDEETTHTATLARLVKTQEQNAELTKELGKVREVLHEQTTYLEAMLNVYAELHALYDLGDCDATIAARTAIAKAKGDQS